MNVEDRREKLKASVQPDFTLLEAVIWVVGALFLLLLFAVDWNKPFTYMLRNVGQQRRGEGVDFGRGDMDRPVEGRR